MSLYDVLHCVLMLLFIYVYKNILIIHIYSIMYSNVIYIYLFILTIIYILFLYTWFQQIQRYILTHEFFLLWPINLWTLRLY